ncbi:hypothetical protein KHQ89_01895 [Mycoplasmatota bacterium]|nr:hypothetical protein KHQ89_01895 [Mycoplasmatota bacterium]
MAPDPPTLTLEIVPLALFTPTIPPAPVDKSVVSTVPSKTGNSPCNLAFVNFALDSIFDIVPKLSSAIEPIAYKFSYAALNTVPSSITKFETTPSDDISWNNPPLPVNDNA